MDVHKLYIKGNLLIRVMRYYFRDLNILVYPHECNHDRNCDYVYQIIQNWFENYLHIFIILYEND